MALKTYKQYLEEQDEMLSEMKLIKANGAKLDAFYEFIRRDFADESRGHLRGEIENEIDENRFIAQVEISKNLTYTFVKAGSKIGCVDNIGEYIGVSRSNMNSGQLLKKLKEL